MEDFNQFAQGKSNNQTQSSIMDLVKALSGKFDGKSQNELLKAIYEEAKKNKQKGVLTNAELDNFATMLAPMLDEKKKNLLFKIVAELKKI